MGSILERVAHRAATIKRADEMTPVEWEAYRKKHPAADPSKHHIVKPQQQPGKPKPPSPGKPKQAPAAPPQEKGTSPKPPESGKPQGKKPPPIPSDAKKKAPEKRPDDKHHDEHGDDKHESHGGGGSEGWKKALKGLKDSAVKFVENAPKAVKHFLGDPDFRKAALKEARESLTKLPKAAKHRLVETVKEEVHEFKTAGEGIRAMMSGKKMSKHQKHAFKAVATHLSIGAAAAAFAATGPLAAAAVFSKNLATHVALKSVKKALGSLHTMNEVHHIGHGVLHFFEHIAAEGDGSKNADPEEAMTDFILAAVAKQIEQLTDDDFSEVLNNLEAEQDKTAAIAVVSRYLSKQVVAPPRFLDTIQMAQELERLEFVLHLSARP